MWWCGGGSFNQQLVRARRRWVRLITEGPLVQQGRRGTHALGDRVIAQIICSNPDAFFDRGLTSDDDVDNMESADNNNDKEKENFVAYFGAEVTDYYCEGDENNYNDHVFTLRVWVGQRVYHITRSYSAFCELDIGLRKKFPKTNIPAIPLAGATNFVKSTSYTQRAYMANNDPNNPNAKITSSTSSKSLSVAGAATPTGGDRQSFFRKSSTTASVVAGMNSVNRPKTNATVRGGKFKDENVDSKQPLLNVYLNQIFLIPEVLMSDCVLYFLDEESVDGQIISKLEASEDINEV
jgi:hypothetical protein